MQIFDELKVRGVEAIGFLSMDGVTGLEEGARAIFPLVVVQRCIVHLVRNSIRYIPRKEWAAYPGAVAVWEKNFAHVEQLFSYGSAVRKIMYTMNAVESVNASFRKVTKKGGGRARMRYSSCCIYAYWNSTRSGAGTIPNGALIRNQLLMDERIEKLMQKYDVIC